MGNSPEPPAAAGYPVSSAPPAKTPEADKQSQSSGPVRQVLPDAPRREQHYVTVKPGWCDSSSCYAAAEVKAIPSERFYRDDSLVVNKVSPGVIVYDEQTYV